MLLLTNIFLTFHILIVGFFFTVKLSVIFTKAIHVVFVKIPLMNELKKSELSCAI